MIYKEEKGMKRNLTKFNPPTYIDDLKGSYMLVNIIGGF